MAAKSFDTCLREVKSRGNWSGTDLADWSPAAIDMLLQLIEAGKPVVKARLYERQLKAGQGAFQKLETSMRELKAVQFEQLQEAAKFAALKTPPALR